MDLKLWSKIGFGVLIIASFAILIERLTAVNNVWVPENETLEKITEPTPSTAPLLNEMLGKCLKEHVKALNYYSLPEENVTFHRHFHENTSLGNNSLFNTSSKCPLAPDLCMHYFIRDFSKLMAQMDIKLQLIEPSLLFCLLPKSKKYSLITRGFSPSKLKSLRNVVVFGITENEANLMEEKSTRMKIAYSGFRIQRFPTKTNFKSNNHHSNEALQYFIKFDRYIIQLVVFYSRETYLWHPGLNATGIQSRNMLFIDDSAYDNFTTIPMNVDIMATSEINLPSESQCFLLQVISSKFLECKQTAHDLKLSSTGQVQTQVVSAIQEIKKVLGSQMVNFWLWSKSLLGWYEKCDVVHYTNKLELSLLLNSVIGYNFSALFSNSKCRTIKEDFDLHVDPNIELECEELTVTISLMHEDKNITWNSFEDEKHKLQRQIFPSFEVCSTDVFGLKVHVPCFTSSILETRIGQVWKNSTHQQK